jgi:SIR2-like domain
MKWLDKDSRENVSAIVDADGNLFIGGIPFSPVAILGSYEDSYTEAFLAWFNEEWIPLRNARLADILRDKANRQRFKELSQAIRAEQVVPFIGSGLSSPSGMPLWSGFLRDLRKDSTLPEADLESLLNAGQYEDAAAALLQHMPQHLFDERLEQTFFAMAGADILGSVRLIPEIFTDTIVTTNFDNVLEEVHRTREKPFQEVLNGAAIAQFRVLRGKGKRCLLKIHGDHMTRNGRVLTRDEYEAAYGTGCAARIELEHMFSSEPLLFLGCSLQADRTMELLREVVSADDGTPRNYAFLKRPPDEAVRLAREQFLAARKLFPIWYEGDHDESLEALLFGLVRATGKVPL